jgi:hypothetical protein
MPIARSDIQTGVQETIAYPGFDANERDALGPTPLTSHLHAALKYLGVCVAAVAAWEGIRSVRGRPDKA